MQRKEIGGMACLVLTAMIWGFAFVSQVQGMDSTTPLFFGATRFTLGAVSLLPLLWFRRDGIARRERARRAAGHGPDVVFGDGRKMTMPAWLGNPVVASVICGVVLFTASTVQQYGILYSGSAGRSGFITALYIVMTPLLAFVVLRRRVHAGVMVSVAISVVGFYLLCVTDGFGSITVADVVLLLTAVLFAGHILVIDTCSDATWIRFCSHSARSPPPRRSAGSARCSRGPLIGTAPHTAGSRSYTRACAPPEWPTRCRWSGSSWFRRPGRR